MKRKLELHTDHCTGCGRCTQICRRGVLQLANDNGGGQVVAIADASRCLGCGHCVRSCRHGALELRRVTEKTEGKGAALWHSLRIVLQFALPVLLVWPRSSGATAWREIDCWQLFGTCALLHLLLFHLRLPRTLRKTHKTIE